MKRVVEVREAALEKYDDEESGETSATGGLRSIIKRGNRAYEQIWMQAPRHKHRLHTRLHGTTCCTACCTITDKGARCLQEGPSPFYCIQIMSRHARLVGVCEFHFQDMPKNYVTASCRLRNHPRRSFPRLCTSNCPAQKALESYDLASAIWETGSL